MISVGKETLPPGCLSGRPGQGEDAAGSAGIKGYGDDTCQSLANDYNTAVNASAEGLIAGDAERAGQNGQLANRIYAQPTDNCLVVD
jgi:hypothetical protein